MVISWHGYSCFKLEFKASGHKVAVVTDPYSPEGKSRLTKNFPADVVTVSHDHDRHNNVATVGGDPFVIDGPGEYEVKEVFVHGVSAFHDDEEGKKMGDNTMYYITAEGLHIAHLGDLKHLLKENQLGDMHSIDILFVPVGGGDVLDAKQAVTVVSQFEPRVVVPMHYRTDKLGKNMDKVEPFLKAMGVASPEEMSKLKISARDLPQEEMKIIVLQQQ
ncbi:MAG: MBL fold metallo-hydrolase [Patescibacteria group bacterium]|nr:MBL fold metallo-hydrolase [Patescibacteria group bacterium]